MIYNEKYLQDLSKTFKNNQDILKLNNKSIFITGATGLIGSTIADYLIYLNKHQKMNISIYLGARDYNKLINRFSIYKEGVDYYYIEYDSLIKFSCTVKFNYIIHCAGNGDPSNIINQPVETILGNIKGLSDLLFYAKEKSVNRVLFVSSSEVYGINNINIAHVENQYGIIDALNIRACYPISKKCGENLCIAFSNEHNVDSVIVRPGHIYGPQMSPHDSRATAQFLRNVINGSDIIMKSNGLQLRSYCYSLDCASAILTVLLNGRKCEAYNISNSNSICTIKEFAEELALQTGHKVVIEKSSDNEKKSYNFMNNSSLNSAKLEALGWIPSFSLSEGISCTINQFRQF